MAETRTTKSIRLNADTQRPLKLLSAYEDKGEGQIVEEALAVYLQFRSLAYSNQLEAARELAHSTPETAGEIVGRLSDAIEEALGQQQRAPVPGQGKARLRARAQARADASEAPA